MPDKYASLVTAPAPEGEGFQQDDSVSTSTTDIDFDLREILEANRLGFTSHSQRTLLVLDMQKALEYQQLERVAADIDKGFRKLFATLFDTYLHNRTRKK